MAVSWSDETVPPPMRGAAPFLRRRRWWLALPLLIAAAAGTCLLALRQGSAQSPALKPGAGQPARSFPVSAVAARTGDFGIYLTGLGSVVPAKTVTVRSRVDGQLMHVAFLEGQEVQAGDLLAQIDPRPFQVQLAQAQGQLARDQALLRNAQVDLQRYRNLVAEDSIARQQLDTQEALVRQYEAALKVDQSQVDSAKLQLTYARITSPITGRLGLRLVDVGNIVHANDTTGLVVITQVHPITVVFSLPEDQLPQVLKKVRAKQTLAVDAYDREQKNKLATGTLQSVDNLIDPNTGTVRLRALFQNEDGLLFPNQFVNVRLQLDVKQGSTLIPTAGLQRGAQGPFVYVVNPDHTASMRPITIGAVQGDTVAVDSGLQPGELVIVDGADKLRDGVKVEVQGDDGAQQHGGEAGPRRKGHP
jgi:multidrug efflux system membrane fusion protein